MKYLTSKGQEDAFLDAVDLVIALLARWMDQTSKANRAYYRNYVTKLDSLLTFAGSAWRVAPNGRGLVRRLDEAVVQATKQVTASDSASAEHLLQAWQSAYGRNPSASRAYSEAIKAVEAAAAPVVLPNDRLATLGKIIAALRQGLQRWELAIPGQTRPAADPSTLLGMLELLWHGQTDRHGGINPTRPIPPEAGPAAVHLAVTLVQWFQSGVVRRTDNTS